MREVVIVALAAFLIGIMAAALLVHFLRGEAAAMSAPASRRLGQSRNRNSLDCGFGQNRLKAALPPSSVLPTG
jgi:hypothetical protein